MAIIAAMLLSAAGAEYTPAGRRDPFVPLNAAPIDTPQACGAGLAGVRASELSLRGIVRMEGERVALMADAVGRSWIARTGDRLCDGVVAVVDAGAVVLKETVSEPLSTERTRERRLLLHP